MKKRIILIVLALFLFTTTSSIIIALNISPIRLKKDTFVYELGSQISQDLHHYISANEIVIKNTSLDLTGVKNEIGIYQASVTYLEKKYPFKIKIEDTTKPIISVSKNLFYFDVNKRIVAEDLIDDVADNSLVKVYFITEKKEKVLDYTFKKEGTYIFYIVAQDQVGNETAKHRIKIIASSKGAYPSISGIDAVIIENNTSFNPLKGVRATDGYGKDITSSIKIMKNDVNIKKNGVYEVIYSVTNSKNNTFQRSRKVTVIDKK